MLFWTLAALALYLIYVFLPALLYIPQAGLLTLLGGRDSLPEPGVLIARARRAQVNYQESLLVFIPLALLSMILAEGNDALALRGAQIFVLARVVYLPAYISAIPGVRSVIWGIALFGLGMMAASLL